MNENTAVQKAQERKELSLATNKGIEEMTNSIMTSLDTIVKSSPNFTYPMGYDAGNEIRSALLYIKDNVKDRNGKSALEVCSKGSVLMALRDMALQGLSVTKKQVYPIVYGDQLQLQRSYFGDQTVLKRIFKDYEVGAEVIHEGDAYDYRADDRGFVYIENFRPELENRDKPIKAAFVVIYNKKTRERVYGDVMTWGEIQKSWAQAKTHNVHDKFPQEMSKRTVIRRAVKGFINTADPASTIGYEETLKAFNRSTEAEYINDDQSFETPRISEAKILHSKSKGTEGLKAMMEARRKHAADIDEEEEAPQERTEEATDASQGEVATSLPQDDVNAATANPDAPVEAYGYMKESGEIVEDDSLPF